MEGKEQVPFENIPVLLVTEMPHALFDLLTRLSYEERPESQNPLKALYSTCLFRCESFHLKREISANVWQDKSHCKGPTVLNLLELTLLG